MTGTLYLVATPIGNLEDITFRAIRILQTVDLIAAEDTRHTAKLLNHYQIKTPTLSYHQHNHQARITQLLDKLTQGKNIALVTDAGTPAISDPGYNLVVDCIANQIEIVPIPGAIAGITGLIASGLPTDRFVFEGFLPTKKKVRESLLQSLQGETRTMIFYEAPHRLSVTLTDFSQIFGLDRQITLGRELTKLHEEFLRMTIIEAIDYYQNISPKGEYTLIVQGKNNETKLELSLEEIKAELTNLLTQGMSKSSASQYLAQFTHLSRQEIYRLSLDITTIKDED